MEKDKLLKNFGEKRNAEEQIDKSEFIGNKQNMYGFLNYLTFNKGYKVFCVLYNKTKENIMKYVENNVMTDKKEI